MYADGCNIPSREKTVGGEQGADQAESDRWTD